MTVADAVVAAIALQRVAELAYARRNERRLLRLGGHEAGARHYPLFVLLHAGWLATVWVLADPTQAVIPLLALYAALQPLRLWVIASLGPFWTTRVITVPGAPIVRRGPYRLLRHPNYVVALVEVVLLPLAFQLWLTSAVFLVLKLALLKIRVDVENEALQDRRSATARAPADGPLAGKQS
jgi:methyltransferase